MSDKPASRSNGPVYANAYTTLVPIARAHGYALAVHGSMVRDMDLIAVPWVERPAPAHELVDAFAKAFYFTHILGPELKEHGRSVYTLAWPGECFIDLSVMPAAKYRAE